MKFKNVKVIGKLLTTLVLIGFVAFNVLAQESNKLAVLVGADWYRETASHNDIEAMHKALRERGFSAEEIVSLDGNLSRSMVIALLTQIQKRTIGWKNGTVFLYYSGHGTYRRISETEVEPGINLNRNFAEAEQKLLWREVFETLKLPPQVKLLLLPDN